jgi:ubiquinone/menaquinone biosynthesis C-methylase UbiE/uncharacterized protein YbaR (Trm112 family)
MLFKGVEIVCPNCKGALIADLQATQQFACVACQQVFPIIEGIPDFRVFPDPYIGIDADREKAIYLTARSEQYDFVSFLDFYYQSTQVVTPEQARLYKRSVLAGEGRSQAALLEWEVWTAGQGTAGNSSFLEIGCGTGSLLVAASSKYSQVVGVDIALRWLIMAKKRLCEAGLDLPLICACAEALPFPEKSFDRIGSESTIEHLEDQASSFGECRRVLKDGGYLFLTTPNRYSLGPDPQTGIWAGSLLPASVVAKLVTRQGGIPPRRRLLSQSQLVVLLRDAGFRSIHIFLPEISPAQRRSIRGVGGQLVDIYNKFRDKPIIRDILLKIGPMLIVTASNSN